MGSVHIAAQGSSMRRVIRAERTPVSSGLTPEQALGNLRSGLDYFFGETSAADLAAQMDADRARIHELRDAIAARLEAEFAVLDALSPDPDLEDTATELHGRGFLASGPDDAEDGCDAELGTDDNGIADAAGAWQQGHAPHDPFAYGFTGWHGRLFGGAR